MVHFVPGTPPAIWSANSMAVMDTSWPSAAKITPSGPNASLPMCLKSGVTPVVAVEFDADEARACSAAMSKWIDANGESTRPLSLGAGQPLEH